MNCRDTFAIGLSVLFAAFQAASAAPPLRAVLVGAGQLDAELPRAKARGLNTIVLAISDSAKAAEDRAAAEKITATGMALHYWIEIARHAPTADAQPLWMASLQGHDEWRRLFPNAPLPQKGEVAKAYPWVPILYRECFDAHLLRVKKLLAGLPAPQGILLNDLQAAPSACGCGNILCRWSPDYGPIKTATTLGPNAAAQFVTEVGRLSSAEIIPVWVTECEEHDREGPCAGVACFRGLCWREYVKQLTPLAVASKRIGVLLPLRDFERELPAYAAKAGWITHALGTFQTMPPRYGGQAVPASRLIAVVQAWDVEGADIQGQIDRASEGGVAGFVISRFKIDQRWEPRLVAYPSRN